MGNTAPSRRRSGAYRYAGRRFDAETGLYFYRARAYSTALGRFLQTDPIGTKGGVNLYAYVGNDPVNNVDPTGLANLTVNQVVMSDAPPDRLIPGAQYAQAALGLCAVGPGGCVVGFGITAGQIVVGGAVVGVGVTSGILLNEKTNQTVLQNENQGDQQANPPPGSKPIDQTPWSGDHQDIKGAIGAGPKDNVKIAPNGEVWGQNPDGSWTNHGPAGDYTSSGGPSGRKGRDRNQW